MFNTWFFGKKPKKTNAEIEAEEEAANNVVTTKPKFIIPRDIEETDGYGPPTEILPHLFLGSMSNASRSSVLAQHSITYILNVAEESSYTPHAQVCYLKLVVDDMVDEQSHQYDTFEEAYKFIGIPPLLKPQDSTAHTTPPSVHTTPPSPHYTTSQTRPLIQVTDKAKEENGVCLVHCMRGRSRSATIVIGMPIV